MASSLEFVEYVCDQIRSAGEIRYKKMFGEYGIYCEDKIIGTICDNTFYLKVVLETEDILKGTPLGEPYPGAKPCYVIESFDNQEFLKKVIEVTTKALPKPKPKKPKITKGG